MGADRKLWELCWSDFGHYESGFLTPRFARCDQPLWLEHQQLTVCCSSAAEFHSLVC